MEGDIIIFIHGALSVLMVKLDYKCPKKDLKYKDKKPIIFASCDKAIYGSVTAALVMSYKKLIGNISDWRFKMN